MTFKQLFYLAVYIHVHFSIVDVYDFQKVDASTFQNVACPRQSRILPARVSQNVDMYYLCGYNDIVSWSIQLFKRSNIALSYTYPTHLNCRDPRTSM